MSANSRIDRRTERIDVRVTKRTKDLIETAAALQGMSVSAFVLSCAVTRASETVRLGTGVQLSARDSQAFARAMLQPQGPNKELREARERYFVEVEG